MSADTLDEPDLTDAVIARPEVARRASNGRGWLGYGATGVAGILTLVALSAHRTAAGGDGLIGGAKAATVAFTTPQPLPSDAATGGMVVAAANGATLSAPQFANTNQVAAESASALPMADMAPVSTTSTGTMAASGVTRLTAPAVVVDLGASATSLAPAAKPGGLANPAIASDGKGGDDGTATFVQRAATRQDPAHAASIGHLGSIVSEGTVISATMETAINSDLPGFARAVIARDVMSFDGTRMLIPRGSRVLGQYKSGVAMGTSRVFIIWTRLIRPDGIAVDLTSPGGDDLGRGGLGGKVDRHFFQRFGGSILMSVLNGAISLGTASLGNGLPVYINSVADAGQAATSAMKSSDISPTIKTPQGAAVKIFVSRDLDFSGVEQPQ